VIENFRPGVRDRLGLGAGPIGGAVDGAENVACLPDRLPRLTRLT
jgi:hypothetical protein